jgi:hypothetical protein
MEQVIEIERQINGGLFNALPPVEDLRSLILSPGQRLLWNAETPNLGIFGEFGEPTLDL